MSRSESNVYVHFLPVSGGGRSSVGVEEGGEQEVSLEGEAAGEGDRRKRRLGRGR